MEEKMEEEIEDRYKNIFDAYLHLQTESYEMITRNVAIHNWMREIYDRLKENPEMGIDEIYGMWGDNFWKIYENLFSMFFRPFKVVTYPFGELMEAQSEIFTPESLFGIYADSFRMFGESQLRLLKGFSDVFKGYEKEDDISARMRELMPLNLLRNMADEGAETYFETLNRIFEYLGESQFLLPKTFFVNAHNFSTAYSKIYGLWRRYELMFRSVWEKSLQKLASWIDGNREGEFEDFFNAFRKIFSEEYDEVLRSKEFIEAQNKIRDALTDLTGYAEKMMEAQMEMFPVMPFAPRKEVDEIEKRIHNHKKISNALERRIAEIEKKFDKNLDELDVLKKKMEKMEVKEEKNE
jgi:uncharacterized coiled-coil protein SlyX